MKILPSLKRFPVWLGIFFWSVLLYSPFLAAQPRDLDLEQSLEKTLHSEEQSLAQLHIQFEHVRQIEKNLETELNAYKIQISAYNNLLLVPGIPLDELGNVREHALIVTEELALRLKEFLKARDALEQLRTQTEQQFLLNQEQLNDITIDTSAQPKNAQLTVTLSTLQQLTARISEKRQLLEQMQTISNGYIGKLTEIQGSFTRLIEKFEQQIETRKMQVLLERQANPLTLLGYRQLTLEFAELFQATRALISTTILGQGVLHFGGFFLIRLLVLAAFVSLLLFRAERFCLIVEEKFSTHSLWRYRTVSLFRRSLFFAGIVLFLSIYVQISQLYSATTMIQVMVAILHIWLFSQWLLDALKLWARERGDAAPHRLFRQLRGVILLSRGFGVGYVLIEWALGSSSVILLLARLLFEASLIIWSVLIYRQLREMPPAIFPVKPEFQSAAQSIVMAAGYVIVSGGFLLELLGYGQFARYWYFSWGQSSSVILWGFLLLMVVQELNVELQAMLPPDNEKSSKTSLRVRWMLVRTLWVALPTLFCISILFAWGAKRVVLSGMFNLFTYPIPISGMQMSLLGLIYALLLVMLTRLATRLWRDLLRKRIFANSGLDIGIQASVTTITVYAIWLFGILSALYAIGVSATSLAFAFGALGIGLGFGLQSIFNNFVSGLILLFERPIEVGDVVEISGILGKVEKINVRSTVVRTFDNAALIIPNADIISRQLTNWTFQDARSRRTIMVHVASHNNPKMIETVLHDIAEQHPRVLKEPAPTVLLTDSDAGGLTLKLHIWTILDYGIAAENDIRFEIDRIFREKQI